MSAIRFDADANAVADEDEDLAEEWGSCEDSIWYLTDGMSNGRWLYVDPPSAGDGIPLGIARGVYTKYLSAEAARSLAAALLVAADEADRVEREREEQWRQFEAAKKRCLDEFGHHDFSGAPASWDCARCGSKPETVAYTFPSAR